MIVEDIIRRYEGRKFSASEEIFFRNFCRYLRNDAAPSKLEHMSEILEGVFDDKMNMLKEGITVADKSSPVLITVVKDELIRIREFFRHYRRIGVKKFIILDNASQDGTREFCMSQDDTDVFSIERSFTSARHVSWINKLLLRYGFGRWYISVDADELLDFPGSENFGVDDLVRAAELLGLCRVAAVTVDFYPDADLFAFPNDSIHWDNVCWFDTDGYEMRKSKRCLRMVGGPRKRVLGTYSVLSKYPMFYLRPQDIFISVHYLWPFKENFASKWFLVLKHYEFLNEEDRRKMAAIIEQSNYASNSREYKEMLETVNGNPALSFWHIGSAKYSLSANLMELPFMSSIFQEVQ